MTEDEEAKNLLLGKSCKYCKFIGRCIYRIGINSVFNYCHDFQLDVNQNRSWND